MPFNHIIIVDHNISHSRCSQSWNKSKIWKLIQEFSLEQRAWLHAHVLLLYTTWVLNFHIGKILSTSFFWQQRTSPWKVSNRFIAGFAQVQDNDVSPLVFILRNFTTLASEHLSESLSWIDAGFIVLNRHYNEYSATVLCPYFIFARHFWPWFWAAMQVRLQENDAGESGKEKMGCFASGRVCGSR